MSASAVRIQYKDDVDVTFKSLAQCLASKIPVNMQMINLRASLLQHQVSPKTYRIKLPYLVRLKVKEKPTDDLEYYLDVPENQLGYITTPTGLYSGNMRIQFIDGEKCIMSIEDLVFVSSAETPPTTWDIFNVFRKVFNLNR